METPKIPPKSVYNVRRIPLKCRQLKAYYGIGNESDEFSGCEHSFCKSEDEDDDTNSENTSSNATTISSIVNNSSNQENESPERANSSCFTPCFPRRSTRQRKPTILYSPSNYFIKLEKTILCRKSPGRSNTSTPKPSKSKQKAPKEEQPSQSAGPSTSKQKTPKKEQQSQSAKKKKN